MHRKSIKIFVLGIILTALLTYIALLTTQLRNEHVIGQKNLAAGGDPIIYINSPVVKASGFISFTAGNYDGIPVVIYKAGSLYMPSGQVIIGIGPSYNITLTMSSAEISDATIYAANITATAYVIIPITITITPQNVYLLSILSTIASELLPLYNVKIYAYYINSTSISYSSINVYTG
ncbi:hypothetical protein [Vulcanisaeta souniana]|uniref:Uncharacterized protein n=1 Tax=Vulcanisaeta souniana JCM 11219 TaxID=1293586 RepID=A0A830EDW8_9CREN|nr:hypothetical protein [Vulcanisaeta souniana]BDR92459.1 hypothetical protein Vsou_15520 [Vulcanisaeta souniana JCM 11219]GGI75689.1 hypothetical protein GCM10007112_10610 [Vulcanisaeta souniana JCM 11219]